MGHLEAVCWLLQPHLAPKWFVDKLARGSAVIQPLPHAKGSERSRSASEMAIRRDFKTGRHSYGKDRREHYAKTG